MFRKKDAGNSPKVEQSVAKAVSYEYVVYVGGSMACRSNATGLDGALKALVLGSVSRALAATGPCPVLIVNDRPNQTPGERC